MKPSAACCVLVLFLQPSLVLGQDLVGPESSGAASSTPREEPTEAVVIRPLFLSGSRPTYPSGESKDVEVVLKLWIATDGSVERAEAVSGGPPFARLAEESALGFRFEPARKGGTAVRSIVLFRIEFLAPQDEPAAVLRPASSQGAATQHAKSQHAKSQAPVEVAVTGQRTPGSTRLITDSDARIIPGAEGDPVRAVQVLPGTVPTLMSGPFIGIRGAPPGLVGSWFDGIELPYLFHLARGTAVVHPWLVESAALHAAGAPSRLGNAAGGYIEATAAPPEGRLRVGGRVRATEAALGAEVPFAGGRGSVMAAGRYSYTQPLVSLIAPEFALDFWDYQTRASYRPNASGRLEVTSFGSGDITGRRVGGAVEEIFNASFHRAAVRYIAESTRGETRVGVIYGHDRWDSNQSQFKPRSHSLTAHVDNLLTLGGASAVRWGARTSVRLQQDQYLSGPTPDSIASFQRADEHASLWGDYDWNPSPSTSLLLGVRADVYASDATPVSGSAVEAAVGPRFSLSHQLSPLVRLHNSFGYHAAPPSTGQRPPGRTFSVWGGLTSAFLSDVGVEFSLPGDITLDTAAYHNAYFNTGDVGTLRALNGQLNAVFEAPSIARGQGQAYGLEVSVRRSLVGRLQGLLSYSLNRSTRTLGRVDGYAEFDRTHIFDAALGYAPRQGWLFSVRGSAFTGYPARVDSVLLAAAPPRTEPYYQIDAQVSKRWKLTRDGAWLGASLGILNATLQKETNDLFCTADQCQTSLVGPATIPTLGVEGEI